MKHKFIKLSQSFDPSEEYWYDKIENENKKIYPNDRLFPFQKKENTINKYPPILVPEEDVCPYCKTDFKRWKKCEQVIDKLMEYPIINRIVHKLFPDFYIYDEKTDEYYFYG